MSRSHRFVVTLFVLVATIEIGVIDRHAFARPPDKSKLDTTKIESLTGGKGTYNESEGVFKVSWPRKDVSVSVDGVALDPFMGLTSWVTFQPGVKVEAMIMGDLVLMQDEVNPVMSVLLDGGIAVTALHNHFFYDEPKVYFMHVGGESSLDHLGPAVRKAFDKIKEIRGRQAQPAKSFSTEPLAKTSAISAKPIEDA